MSLTQINSNIPGLNSLRALNRINRKLSTHQTRLSTGKKINSTEEDPAGFALATGLERRVRGLDVARQNVNNAQNILNVAEGGYQNQLDILQTVKEKATQAADYSLSTSQRTAIHEQVSALLNEIDSIEDETTFNGSNLIDGNYDGYFQTGEGANDNLHVKLSRSDSTSIGSVNISGIDLKTTNGASTAINTVSSAIDSLAESLQTIGQYKARLSAKENTLSVASTNTEAVRSSVEDADFAKEQMEVMKLQIMQQTAVSSFTQANSSGQVVLSIVGR